MPEGSDPSVLDHQHAEIDHAKEELRDLRRFLNRFVDERNHMRQTSTERYLRGLHDGLAWGEREVDCITKYTDNSRVYDPRGVSDDSLSEHLKVVVTEARSENWGNVAVNAEKVVEVARELQGASADDKGGDDAER